MNIKRALEEARKKGYSSTPDYHSPAPVIQAAAELDIELTESEASLIWEWHSESYAAGWLTNIDKETVEAAIQAFCHTFTPAKPKGDEQEMGM